MNVKDLLTALIKNEAQPKFYARIPDDHLIDKNGLVIGKDDLPREFISGKHYFEIRLAEMFLRNDREYWRRFAPLTVALTEFLYDGKREAFPFMVGNQLLQSIQSIVNGENIQYRNTRIAGPVPYGGGDVALFIGLFGSQVSDLSDRFWKVLEEVVRVFDVTQLSRYIDIARPLQSSLGQLLGMKELEYRAGMRQEFTEARAGQQPIPLEPDKNIFSFREGYWVYANCNENALSLKKLWVKDGSLFEGQDSKQVEQLRSCDYCLVKIEQLVQRSDYTAFPFHKIWIRTQEEIYKNDKGNRARATKLLLELSGAIVKCPDITVDQRYQLIRAYKANFEFDFAEAGGQPGRRAGANLGKTRGEVDLKTAPGAINRTAVIAAEAGASLGAIKGIKEISENWGKIPGFTSRSKKTQPVLLTDEMLVSQMMVLEESSKVQPSDPALLVEALTLAAFGLAR